MRLLSPAFIAIVLMALFFNSNTSAADDDFPQDPVISVCRFSDGSSVQVYPFDGQTRYAHYDKADKNDLFLSATGCGFNNIQHTVEESIRFHRGQYDYVAVHDPFTPFDGVLVCKGKQVIARKPCTNGWSPYLIDPVEAGQLQDDGNDYFG